MPSLSIDFNLNVFNLLWGMQLHYVLIEECYYRYKEMLPKTRVQGKGISLLDASNEAFTRPPPTTLQGRGRGTQGRPQGHSHPARGEEARNVKGGVRAPSISKLMA